MSAIGYIEYNGIELFNVSRTAQLSRTLGIDIVRVSAEKYAWIEEAMSGTDYDDVTDAPWYDSGVPESGEFGGFIPLSMSGMDDDTWQAEVTEFITDGGRSSTPRNTTLSIVASVILVAKTERGAEFGKRWMNTVLRGRSTAGFCHGAKLSYFRYASAAAPRIHMRDVSLTRGTSVTKRLQNTCSTAWWVQFTLTANDPYEYGEETLWVEWSSTIFEPHVADGPGLDENGVLSSQTEAACPAPDYTPIFDPLYPAMVPPPVIPNFYPDGWDVVPGSAFTRRWIKTLPFEPSELNVVPIIGIYEAFPDLGLETDARMIRLAIFDYNDDVGVQCEPLFSVMATYIPKTKLLVIDGEQRVCYMRDNVTLEINRADSLVYGPGATPVAWASFHPGPLLIALDVFSTSGTTNMDASVSFVPKSG